MISNAVMGFDAVFTSTKSISRVWNSSFTACLVSSSARIDNPYKLVRCINFSDVLGDSNLNFSQLLPPITEYSKCTPAPTIPHKSVAVLIPNPTLMGANPSVSNLIDRSKDAAFTGIFKIVKLQSNAACIACSE